jgi:hypothetical protein
MTKAEKCNIHYNAPKDIDLYIVGDGTVEEKIAMLEKIMAKIEGLVSYYARNQYAVSAILNQKGREVMGVSLIQIITTKSSTISNVLNWFDIDCCAIALTTETYGEPMVVAEPRCIKAFRSRANVHREHLITKSYATRLGKYMTRGYDYLVPSTYVAKVNDTTYLKSSITGVVLHGAETWGSEIANSIYSDRSDAFMLEEDYNVALTKYLRGREDAIRPSVLSLSLSDIVHGRCEEWIFTMLKSPEQTKMTTLPPLDFSLTPEAMKTENDVKMGDWPVLKK